MRLIGWGRGTKAARNAIVVKCPRRSISARLPCVGSNLICQSSNRRHGFAGNKVLFAFNPGGILAGAVVLIRNLPHRPGVARFIRGREHPRLEVGLMVVWRKSTHSGILPYDTGAGRRGPVAIHWATARIVHRIDGSSRDTIKCLNTNRRDSYVVHDQITSARFGNFCRLSVSSSAMHHGRHQPIWVYDIQAGRGKDHLAGIGQMQGVLLKINVLWHPERGPAVSLEIQSSSIWQEENVVKAIV